VIPLLINYPYRLCITSFFYLPFSTGAKNYTTAYIQPQEEGFKIIVKGKRMLMAHELESQLVASCVETVIPHRKYALTLNPIILIFFGGLCINAGRSSPI
jgi:hypothetical protein